MKSIDRCKEHMQGDRCKLPKFHNDELHISNFHVWGPKIPPTRKYELAAKPSH